MTIAMKQKRIDRFHIVMEADFSYSNSPGFIRVGLYEYGRTVNENHYGIKEEEKAKQCFYRYCRKANKEL